MYTGSIPEVPETYGYIYSIYPCINEHQLAIGESTFDGKEVMRSDKGMFNLYELTRLMAERCKTAREAIALAATQDNVPFLLVSNDGWHPGVVGIVAGRLKDRFGKPSFVAGFEGGLGRGSARSVPGTDTSTDSTEIPANSRSHGVSR